MKLSECIDWNVPGGIGLRERLSFCGIRVVPRAVSSLCGQDCFFYIIKEALRLII